MKLPIDTRRTGSAADSAHQCNLAPTDDDRPILADVSYDVYTQARRDS